MELAIVGGIAFALGLLLAFVSPDRKSVGGLLIPASSAATALVIWEALSWLGGVPGFAWLAYETWWIWAITLIAAAAVAVWLAFGLAPSRTAGDADLFDRLSLVGRTKPTASAKKSDAKTDKSVAATA